MIFIDYYVSKGQYAIVSLNNNEVYDQNIKTLEERNYDIENFEKIPIFNAPLIQRLIENNNNNIDIIIKKLDEYKIKVKNANDLILYLYHSDIPKNKFQKIIYYCDIDFSRLFLIL